MPDDAELPDLPEVYLVRHRIHVLKAAARPRHTLLPAVGHTARWTLRTVFAHHVPVPGFVAFESPAGRPFSYCDSLHYDN